jgi:lysozyme
MLKGIDVSAYQENIDWQKVKAAGMEFAFIKATEGSTYVDPKFARNWAEAKKAGVPRGAYHFFRPRSSLKGQIDNFLRSVPKLEPGDLPPVLDLEVPEDWTLFSVSKRMELVLGWVQAVKEELGLDPILYLSAYFPDDVLGNDGRLDDYPLWVAHYSRGTRPRVPKPWQFYTFWQYTDEGSVAGVSGPVDMNRFNGSIDQLRKFMKK